MNDTKNPVNGRINEAKDAFLAAMAEEGMIDADHILQPENLKYVSGLLDDLCAAAMNASAAAQPQGAVDAVKAIFKAAGVNYFAEYGRNGAPIIEAYAAAKTAEAMAVIAELGRALEGIIKLPALQGGIYPQAEQALTRARAYQNGQPGAASAEPMTQAAIDVLAERKRQIEKEGWDTAHDDAAYRLRLELAMAAACYAIEAAQPDTFLHRLTRMTDVHRLWPWCWSWWKPTDPRRNLVKAGALIQAAIEVIDRRPAAPAQNGGASHE